MLSLHLAVLSLVGLGITVRRRHLVAVFAPNGYTLLMQFSVLLRCLVGTVHGSATPSGVARLTPTNFFLVKNNVKFCMSTLVWYTESVDA